MEVYIKVSLAFNRTILELKFKTDGTTEIIADGFQSYHTGIEINTQILNRPLIQNFQSYHTGIEIRRRIMVIIIGTVLSIVPYWN